jgi:hypothetical protein
VLASSLLALTALTIPSCVFFRSFAHVGPMVESDSTVPTGDAADADVHVDFYGGRIQIRAADGETITTLHTRDNLDEVEPRLEQRREGRHVSTRLWLDTEHNVLFRHDDDDDAVNEWTLGLGTRVPIDLDLGLAMCEGDCDLGAVALKRARVSLGLGETTLRFSRPNPIELDELHVELGAGDFAVRDLGNARCSSISIEAGVGSFDIDCHGEWTRPALLRVEAGMGTVDIRLPPELPVRVDIADVAFGDIAAPDFRQERAGDERHLYSPNWTDEGVHLSIEIEASFGSVNLVRE